MSIRYFLTIALFLSLLLTASCKKKSPVDTEHPKQSQDHIWLHVDGMHIKTSAEAEPANEIFMSVGEVMAYAWEGFFNPAPPTQKELDDRAAEYKAKGCNTVRLAFQSLPYPIGSYFGSGGKWGFDVKQTIEKLLVPVVEACKKNELYCILDMHEHMTRYKTQEEWMGTGPQWAGADIQLWIDHWVKIADYFKDEPWVMGYELCNEPTSAGLDCGPNEVVRDYFQRCIAAVRKVDTRHILFLGNGCYSQPYAVEETWASTGYRPDEPYNQVVFVWHWYIGLNPWNPHIPTWLPDIQKKYNIALICSEFGSTSEEIKREGASACQANERMLMTTCNRNNVGWNVWVERVDESWQNYAQAVGSSIPQPKK